MLSLQQLITRIRPVSRRSVELTVVQEAARRFQIDTGLLKPVRNFPSVVFNFLDTSFLKIIPETERSHYQLTKVYECQQLLSHNFPFVLPLKESASGNLTERIFTGKMSYTAVLFQAANGFPVNHQNWTPEVFYYLGNLTGAMHQAAQYFNSSKWSIGVSEGHRISSEIVNRYIPRDEYRMHERTRKIINSVSNLPKRIDNYGFIHNDIHRGNVMLNRNQLTLIDFDDACYSWFIHDISNIFYFAMLNTWKSFDNGKEYMQSFRTHFWKGYHEYHRLSDADLETLPAWIALRSLAGYAFQLKTKEYIYGNATLQAYFKMSHQYAQLELEKTDAGYFID